MNANFHKNTTYKSVVGKLFDAASQHQIETYTPYDSMHVFVYYPGISQSNNREYVLPDTRFAPYPIVIFLPEIDSEANEYEWLAEKLVEIGFVVAIPKILIEVQPKRIHLTPGIHQQALNPDTYRNIPTSSAIQPIMHRLEEIQRIGLLAGLIDLNTIVLGGHATGGFIAAMNARPSFYRNVKAAFAWCPQSTLAGSMGTLKLTDDISFPDDLPMLLLGATHDGLGDYIIRLLKAADDPESTSFPYHSAVDLLLAMFDHSYQKEYGNKYLAVIEGGNHYTICEPIDRTKGFSHLDIDDELMDQELLRKIITHIIVIFLKMYITQETEDSMELEDFFTEEKPWIPISRRK